MFIDAVQTIHLIWSLLSLIQTEDEKKQFMGLVRPTSASRIKIETLEDWKTPIRGPLFCRRVGWEKPYWIAALWSLLFVKFQYYPTETLKNYLNFVYFSKCCCTEINRVIVKRFWLSYPRNRQGHGINSGSCPHQHLNQMSSQCVSQGKRLSNVLHYSEDFIQSPSSTAQFFAKNSIQ